MVTWLSQGGPMMGLIATAGVVALTVFLERLFHFHRAQIRPDDFLKGMFNVLRRRNTIEAVSICDETAGPVARLVRAAVLHFDEEPDVVRKAMEEEGQREIARLEHRLSTLAMLGRLAPVMGLAGTAMGLMQALMVMQQKAPLVFSGDLSAGLWQALSTTAAGLVLCILCNAGYYLLLTRLDSLLLDMERATGEVEHFLARIRRGEEGTLTP